MNFVLLCLMYSSLNSGDSIVFRLNGKYTSSIVLTKKVINGGHVWFPKYESVKKLIDDSPFEEYNFFHYHDENFNPVMNKIDYMKGYVYRTPDHDRRVQYPKRPMSIVVDCFKT